MKVASFVVSVLLLVSCVLSSVALADGDLSTENAERLGFVFPSQRKHAAIVAEHLAAGALAEAAVRTKITRALPAHVELVGTGPVAGPTGHATPRIGVEFHHGRILCLQQAHEDPVGAPHKHACQNHNRYMLHNPAHGNHGSDPNSNRVTSL